MKSKHFGYLVLAGALLAPVVTLAADSDSDRSSAKAYVKDSVITTKVKAALAREKLSSLIKIRADTDDKGVVYLAGSAPSKADADQAVSIAKAVDGVVSVKNNIAIKPGK